MDEGKDTFGSTVRHVAETKAAHSVSDGPPFPISDPDKFTCDPI